MSNKIVPFINEKYKIVTFNTNIQRIALWHQHNRSSGLPILQVFLFTRSNISNTSLAAFKSSPSLPIH